MAQRAGRAGRHRPGKCFSLVSRQRLASLPVNQTIEMHRVDLSDVVMHVKALDLPADVTAILGACPEPPSQAQITAAIERLQHLGALDQSQNVTSLGRILLQLPTDVAIGKILLVGAFFRCLDKALNLAVVLTTRDPFVAPLAMRAEARKIKASFGDKEARSDPLLVLSAFEQFVNLADNRGIAEAKAWAFDNYLSIPTLIAMDRERRHLLSAMDRAGILRVSMGMSSAAMPYRQAYGAFNTFDVPDALKINSHNVSLQLALIAAAQGPNFAIRQSRMIYRTAMNEVRGNSRSD